MLNKKIRRINKLELLLRQVDKIHLSTAAEMLNVSEMTIRRDLSKNISGMILLGGYIFHASQKNSNYFLLEQQNKNVLEKIHIGKISASLIEDGDIVFFDSGITVSFIASQIPDSVQFTAVCCSINTFMILQEKFNCELFLCGGHYSRDNALITSIQPMSILDSICTTKAFIATSGVDPKYGLTCFRFNETKIKQKAMLKTKEKIIIFDHTKLNKVYSAYIGELDDFDFILCNKTLSKEFKFSDRKLITNDEDLYLMG